MRKIVVGIILLICVIFIASCGGKNIQGLDNFSINNSPTELSYDLLPSSDFLQNSKHISGDYFYFDTGALSFNTQETELLYLVYDEFKYNSTKQFVLEEFQLTYDSELRYKDYQLYKREDSNEYRFYLTAFNDLKKTIVFMSIDITTGRTERTKELVTLNDMGAFLKEYFSFYDFDV